MKNQAANLQIQAYQKSKNSSSDFSKQQTLDENNLKPQILALIKEVSTEFLRIQDSARPSIVKQISHIIFPKLTYLNLRNSKITDVEFIQYLQCPLMVTLELYGNYITNLKSIAKNNTLPLLRVITIYRNPLKQIWPLNRQFMSKHREFQLDDGNQITIEDISFMTKNPGNQVTKIYANSKNRIKQYKIENMLLSFKR